MTAGILTTNGVTASDVADPMVQMSQATLKQFEQYFFMYQMGALIEVLILAFLIFVFKPYLPFIMSKLWNHLPVVGIMTKVRNIVPFGGFTLRNGMYRKELRDNVMYFDKKYLGSYFFMGVPFDMVHIDRGFVQDLIYNKYLSTLNKMGYKTIDSIENALTFNGIDPEADDTPAVIANMGFDSYEQARKTINPSGLTITSEIYAPIASSCPLDALLAYGSDIAPGSIAAQVSDEYEFRKPPVQPNLLLDLIPYAVLFLAMGIAGAMLLTQIK